MENQMKRGVVYCYRLDKKFYVGKTYLPERKRMDKHKYEALVKKSDTPFARAIRKYGWETTKSSYHVLEEVYSDNVKELNRLLIHKETEWIRKLNSLVPNGYNVYEKGQDSPPHTANKENVYQKVSKALKGKYLNSEYSSKPVYCFELDRWYPSIKEAERQTGISYDRIEKCAIGKNCRGAGMTWSFDGKTQRESKVFNVEVECIETGERFESMRKAAEHICGQNPDLKIKNVYSNIKTATLKGWRCQGYHWRKTGRTTPCYQTLNQFGSVTTIPSGREIRHQE